MSIINDLLESLRWHGENAECGCTNVNEDLNEAADTIEQQQQEIGRLCNPWISVEDELPESGVKVLCFGGLLTDLGFTHQTDFALIAGERKEWVFFDGTISDGWSITHWMPLPQQPKKQDHE